MRDERVIGTVDRAPAARGAGLSETDRAGRVIETDRRTELGEPDVLISEREIETLSSVGWVFRLWDREVPGSIPGVSRSSDWAPQLG